jgi:hypothetical protein
MIQIYLLHIWYIERFLYTVWHPLADSNNWSSLTQIMWNVYTRHERPTAISDFTTFFPFWSCVPWSWFAEKFLYVIWKRRQLCPLDIFFHFLMNYKGTWNLHLIYWEVFVYSLTSLSRFPLAIFDLNFKYPCSSLKNGRICPEDTVVSVSR